MPSRNFDAWASHPQARVALIGGSGWVGRALLDRSLAAGLTPDRMRVFTAPPCLIAMHGHEVQTEALTAETRLDDGDWIILHAAIVGPDSVEGGDLVEVQSRNDALLEQIFAMAAGADVRRLVMMSSGAAGQTGPASPAKAAYARMKREHEAEVDEWSCRSSVPILLPRIFNLGGPYISHPRKYALGDFILSLAQTGTVKIGAADPVVRNFVHVLELADVLLHLAADEDADSASFDIGGTQAVELSELARRVAAVMAIDARIERPAPAGGAEDRYVGDGRFYQQVLSDMDRAPIGLDEIIRDTVAYLSGTGVI